VLNQILAFIVGDNLIIAANAIHCAGQIADARPDLLDQIIAAALAVDSATYETPECRNVVIGHVLDLLRRLWPAVHGRPEVVAFVGRQRSNTRAKVARQATELAAGRD